jgi:polysaccharide chain length determinant protein (PEP-CTERM system associated)
VAICTAAAVLIGGYVPKKYRSETLIMLVPQRIPEAYVKAAAEMNIEDRLATLEGQLLSRSRLEKIILDLNLYQQLRQTRPMEAVVEKMRSDITVSVEGKESSAFRIRYISAQAKSAQQATEQLASLFIEENLRDRANVSEDTNQFLESQLKDARSRLEEQERKVEQYRLRYSGQLPSQASANLQAIQNLQLQLQSLREAADRARERRMLVERQVADLQNPDPAVAAVVSTPNQDGTSSVTGLTTAQQLDAARERLGVLQTRYKPTHPDVQAQQRTIRDLEAKLEMEIKQPSRVSQVASPAEIARQKRIRDLKVQLEDLDRELADKQQQDKDLRAVVADYQSKLDAVPTRESDLVELTRDYNTLQTAYQSLLAKREESNLASSLERRTIGERFRVLDPARVPERAFSPNPMFIVAGGAAFGLVFGVLLVGFLEYRDTTLRTEEDVVRLCQSPVLAFVPQMTSAQERRSLRLQSVLKNAAAVLVFLGCVAVIVLSAHKLV